MKYAAAALVVSLIFLSSPLLGLEDPADPSAACVVPEGTTLFFMDDAGQSALLTECTIPPSFHMHCQQYCGAPECPGEAVCVSPTLYDCICHC